MVKPYLALTRIAAHYHKRTTHPGQASSWRVVHFAAYTAILYRHHVALLNDVLYKEDVTSEIRSNLVFAQRRPVEVWSISSVG